MLFPKPKWKKRRKRHPPSIIRREKGVCFLCERLRDDRSLKYVHRHHVFYGGGLRDISEQNGFTCNLCIEHHTDGFPESVHGNERIRRYLCAIFQKEYEKDHTREEFMELIGRNYLN